MQRRNVRMAAGLLLVIALVGGAGIIPAAQAAPAAQAGRLSYTDPGPVAGSLDATTPEAVYQFDCAPGGVASVRVETTSGDLAVDILVQTPDGRTIAQGGSVSSDPNVSLVEAFEAESGGTCVVTLTRSGDTSGAYDVWLLPGYADLATFDTFNDTDAPLGLTWAPYASESMTVATVGQQLQIQVFAENLLGYAVPDESMGVADYFVQADFAIQGEPSYAEYGFVLQLSENPESFYALTFSSDNDWSLYWFDGEWQAIQEWTPSPVVDGADRNPTVGVWVQGDTFRAYFNGAFVGAVTDTAQHASQGIVGVAASTITEQVDPLVVYVDDLVITTPVQAASGLSSLLTPTQPPTDAPPTPTVPARAETLSSWASGSPDAIISELQSMDLVPAGGSIALTVPSSYGDTAQSGFSYFPLGQGNTFADFVLSFDARLVTTGPESGCGMFFRDNQNTNADALVFEDGSFLLGEWDASGNLLDSSVIAYSDAVIPGEGATNAVVVVANGGDMTLFVNGQRVADAFFSPASGEVALELYVAPDSFGSTVQTYCQLNDIWLWEF